MGQQISKAFRRSGNRTVDPTFTRGQGPLHPREQSQLDFLQQHSKAPSNQEMSPELIKFLQDVGPLKGKNETTTSKQRMPRELRQQQQQPHQESMRLAKDVPGITTTRSTNFSYKADEEDTKVGDILDIYRLIALQQETNNTDQTIAKFYAEKPMENNETNTNLMKNALKYLELPVVMQDPEDLSFAGVPKSKVDDFQQPPWKLQHATRVQLVLRDWYETNEQASSTKNP